MTFVRINKEKNTTKNAGVFKRFYTYIFIKLIKTPPPCIAHYRGAARHRISEKFIGFQGGARLQHIFFPPVMSQLLGTNSEILRGRVSGPHRSTSLFRIWVVSLAKARSGVRCSYERERGCMSATGRTTQIWQSVSTIKYNYTLHYIKS